MLRLHVITEPPIQFPEVPHFGFMVNMMDYMSDDDSSLSNVNKNF